MPWHKIQDELEEERLSKSGAAFGSTKRGIAYAYSDKYRKKTIRLGDLLHLDEENVQARLKTMLEAKNLELAGAYVSVSSFVMVQAEGCKICTLYHRYRCIP